MRALVLALVATGSFMLVEAGVGLWTGSLALLADAGHMLTDVAGLGFALAAIWIAQRPANDRKTYGYYRVEILAAAANALLLFAVSGYVLFEAFRRFSDPPEVPGIPLLVVASVGLVVNLVTAHREASQHLVENYDVDKVSFTGSTAAGKKIAATCGERIARVTLELGGKSAAIIRDDFPLEQAAAILARTITLMSGQICAMLSRAVVSKKVIRLPFSG